MLSLKKRYVVIAGILGGFAIAFQDSTASVWHQLQTKLAALSTASPNAQSTQSSTTPTLHSDLDTTSSRLVSNSSLGEHFRSNTFSAENFNKTETIAKSTPVWPARSNGNSMIAKEPNRSTQLPTIRIASFSIEAFNETKLRKVAVIETIARMIRQFDVIALQHIQSKQHNIVPELLDKVNQGDRRYDYCIGPRVGTEPYQQQFAFLFDTDRIETDRPQLYTVDDPQALMEFDPLVGWFRCKAVPSDKAFTFTLVNVRLDPLSNGKELKLLPDLIRSVRQDGRSEDDIILLGNFGYSDSEMLSLRNAGMIFALEGIPTAVTGEAMLDNLVFPARATDEFTGRTGVVDFLRQLNLSIDQAYQISTHMPIWAEFFATEGGSPGYTGSR
ncbi:MAG: endonuclease/exonuclease/phosphatase [Planctomycetota bacterium]|nr:endonuclease/exonuclease/phosphatase [Planctomycetota bacterium]